MTIHKPGRYADAAAAPLLDAVADALETRQQAEEQFLYALRQAHTYHSWTEIAQTAQLPRSTVRYLCLEPDERRRWNGRKDTP